MKQTTIEKINYSDLITSAVKDKGILNNCYSLFHDYSLLNTLYVIRQLKRKGLKITPVKGYKAWNKLNRQVKSELLTNKTRYGFENGLEMLYPVFGYYPLKDKDGNLLKDKNGKQVFRKYVKDFNYYRWHFSTEQTDIIDNSKKSETLTDNKFNINIENLCKEFEIEIVDYNSIDGNCQGWAMTENRQLALNPVADSVAKTAIHEIAHILLAHHKADYSRAIKEAEAETVSYIVLSVCNSKEDLSTCRGYVQHWLGNNEMTQDIAQRITNCASKILNAIKGKTDDTE